MRRIPLTIPLLAALAWPAAALPCKGDPVLYGGRPAEGAVVPRNAQAYVRFDEFGSRDGIAAELYDPDLAEAIPLTVHRHTTYWVRLELPPLRPGVRYEALATIDSGRDPDTRWAYAFVAEGRLDIQAPPAPDATFEAHYSPPNSCSWGGWYAIATVAVLPADDVALYELVERGRDGTPLLWGASPHPAGPATQIRVSNERSLAERDRGLDGRCFGVRARDFAGNTGPVADWHCFGAPAPDAGRPPPDAGTPPPDAGVPSLDAGHHAPEAGSPTPDAGSRTADAGLPAQPDLALEEGGCTCIRPLTPRPGFLVFGLVLALALERRGLQRSLNPRSEAQARARAPTAALPRAAASDRGPSTCPSARTPPAPPPGSGTSS